MKKFILGFILGSMLTAPLTWAAVARDIRISDNNGRVLDINADGTLNVKVGAPS